MSEIGVSRSGRIGGQLPFTSPRGQNGVGVAEQAAVEPVHGDPETACLVDRGCRPLVAGAGQQQRPQPPVVRGPLLRQRVQEGDTPAEGVDGTGPIATEQCHHGPAAAPGAALDLRVAGRCRGGERKEPLHLPGFLPETMDLAEEHQRDRPDLTHTQPFADGKGSPGVLVGIIKREPEEEGSRQLEVKNSGSTPGTKIIRGPARLAQAPGTGMLEHLDCAQLMQRVSRQISR